MRIWRATECRGPEISEREKSAAASAAKSPAQGRAFRRSVPFVAVASATGRSAATARRGVDLWRAATGMRHLREWAFLFISEIFACQLGDESVRQCTDAGSGGLVATGPICAP
jgi:hypothetical protein